MRESRRDTPLKVQTRGLNNGLLFLFKKATERKQAREEQDVGRMNTESDRLDGFVGDSDIHIYIYIYIASRGAMYIAG